MAKEEIDFYTLGMKKIHDHYANLTKMAQEIEQQYGADARLEFECGILVGGSQNVSTKIETIIPSKISGSKIVTDDTEMNNSYINEPGVGPRL